MVRNRNIKSLIAACFASLYFFVALFSQNLHHHGKSDFSKLSHSKSEKTISKTSSSEDLSNCLSCHFLHSGHTVVPTEFNFSFVNDSLFERSVFAYQQRFASLEVAVFYLRGPPHYSI